jgi:hypothetical protein
MQRLGGHNCGSALTARRPTAVLAGFRYQRAVVPVSTRPHLRLGCNGGDRRRRAVCSRKGWRSAILPVSADRGPCVGFPPRDRSRGPALPSVAAPAGGVTAYCGSRKIAGRNGQRSTRCDAKGGRDKRVTCWSLDGGGLGIKKELWRRPRDTKRGVGTTVSRPDERKSTCSRTAVRSCSIGI